MNFSQLVERLDHKKKNLECACSNCEKKTYCLTEYVCYKSFNSNACQNQACYGCFTSHMQTLQVIYTILSLYLSLFLSLSLKITRKCLPR